LALSPKRLALTLLFKALASLQLALTLTVLCDLAGKLLLTIARFRSAVDVLWIDLLTYLVK